MKKGFVYILILLLLLSYVKFNVRADDCVNKVGSLPYGITAIFSSENNIFVGTKQGFFVSKNAGKTFTEKDKGIADLEITSVVFLKGTLFLGTANSGLYVSHDMGDTWISLMDKLNCPTVSSLNTDGKNVFVTSLCSGFHFSDDLGKTWKERNGGLPTLRTTAFLKTSQGRCFLGTDRYGMFYSDTLGKTCIWDKFFEKYTITSLSYIDNTLLIGTNSGIFAGGILSDDFKKLNMITQ
jgi:ligand-binding sensor domain-containing protein